MKRVFVLTMALCLAITMTVTGQDLTGKMLAGGYAGYTLGFGDAFPDDDVFSRNAGISFGGTFHYGINEKMMIGGELGFQSFKTEVELPAILGGSSSETSTEMNILFNGLYAINYTDDENAFFVTAGGGLYGGDDSELGIFGGIVYRKMVSETIGAYVMPRFHYVMSDPAMTMLQIAVGVHIPVGSN